VSEEDVKIEEYPKVEITDLFKPKSKGSNELFGQSVWKLGEFRDYLTEYIEKNNLQHTKDRNLVKIDTKL